MQTQNLNVSPGWGTNTSGFFNQQFTPNHAPGPKDIPSNVNAESSTLDFFSLFWNDDLWDLLVTETNRQAFYVTSDKQIPILLNRGQTLLQEK